MTRAQSILTAIVQHPKYAVTNPLLARALVLPHKVWPGPRHEFTRDFIRFMRSSACEWQIATERMQQAGFPLDRVTRLRDWCYRITHKRPVRGLLTWKGGA